MRTPSSVATFTPVQHLKAANEPLMEATTPIRDSVQLADSVAVVTTAGNHRMAQMTDAGRKSNTLAGVSLNFVRLLLLQRKWDRELVVVNEKICRLRSMEEQPLNEQTNATSNRK